MNPLELSCHSILVVDDDPDIRTSLAEILGDEGYRVAGARNGREALDYLRRRTRPSLILLDMMMPDMDGWLFRREQQKLPELASIPPTSGPAAGGTSVTITGSGFEEGN